MAGFGTGTSLACEERGLSRLTDCVMKRTYYGFSILASILMCKIVYELTAKISASLFRRYNNLPRIRDSPEWRWRAVSTFHAIVVASASLYVLVVSDPQTELCTNGTSFLSEIIVGVSIGYCLSNLAMMFYYYPALGGMASVISDLGSTLPISLSLLTGNAHLYTLMAIFTETTTPFVNLRWYLDVAGLRASTMYICNCAAILIVWLGVRFLMFVHFSHHTSLCFAHLKTVCWPCYYTMITVAPVLTLHNFIWYWKICKGIPALLKGRHNQ